VLDAYEANSEPAILMVARDGERGRLLGILLEGFGFRVLECRDQGQVREALVQAVPSVAMVDASLGDARESMALIHERGDLPVLLLVGGESGAPERVAADLGADAWARLDTRPDGILSALRGLLVGAALH
jgi:DNA-binding response OmpR family regulator